jgi:Cu-Zn family superoxide dismutase
MSFSAIAVFDPRINNGIGGTIRFDSSLGASSTRVTFDLYGFQPQAIHAIHIHEFGDLSQGCTSLGAHFNPTRVAHGHGFSGHAGDLFNNLQAGDDGRYVLTFNTPMLSLDPQSKSSVIGRSVVIHAHPDDLGNAEMYNQWTTEQLQQRAMILGYNIARTHAALLKKFQSEAQTTGNASTRLACAVIGWSSGR